MKDYCGTKDLVPGRAYYGAGVWRNTWVYLGRSSDKEYVWFFIGCEERLLNNPTLSQVLKDINTFGNDACSVTKSIKKVKPIENLLKDTDSNNYVSEDAKKLALSNFRIGDIDNITQESLDTVARIARSRIYW